MAVGDLYKVQVNVSTNNRHWSFGLWVQESSPSTPSDDGAVIARAVDARIGTQLLPIISTASYYEGVQAWRRFPTPSRPGYFKKLGGRGTVFGDSMSNDNSLFINMRQSAQDARFNGGINIAGQSDNQHSGNVFDPTFLSGPVKTFTDQFVGIWSAAVGDSGAYEFVVVSKAFTPPQNFIGTPFDVTEAKASDRVLTQRRRSQKSRGFTNV